MLNDSVSFQNYQFQSHVIPKYIYDHFSVRESLFDEQVYIIKLANSRFHKVPDDRALFKVSFNRFDYFDPIQNILQIEDYMKRFLHFKKICFDFLFSKLYILREKDALDENFKEFSLNQCVNIAKLHTNLF